MYQYFNEVRGNLIDGEYNFHDCQPAQCPRVCCHNTCCSPQGTDCINGDYCSGNCCTEYWCCEPRNSWSGVQLGYGQYPLEDGPEVCDRRERVCFELDSVHLEVAMRIEDFEDTFPEIDFPELDENAVSEVIVSGVWQRVSECLRAARVAPSTGPSGPRPKMKTEEPIDVA